MNERARAAARHEISTWSCVGVCNGSINLSTTAALMVCLVFVVLFVVLFVEAFVGANLRWLAGALFVGAMAVIGGLGFFLSGGASRHQHHQLQSVDLRLGTAGDGVRVPPEHDASAMFTVAATAK